MKKFIAALLAVLVAATSAAAYPPPPPPRRYGPPPPPPPPHHHRHPHDYCDDAALFGGLAVGPIRISIRKQPAGPGRSARGGAAARL